MFKTVLLLLALGSFLGCGVRAPMTQFKGATISQATAEAIALAVEFDVSNTNDEPLHILLYEYSVTANGKTVYHGKTAAEQTVPRWSIISSVIPIVIRREDLLGREEVTWRLSGTLGYVASNAMSETLFNAGLWKTTTPIRGTGSIPVPPID